MTRINKDTLERPYAAFDVSVFQPFATDTRTVEIIAFGLAQLTLNVVPQVLFDIGATTPSEGVSDVNVRDLREMDLYKPSRVFRNALRKLHSQLLLEPKDSRLAELNPFISQDKMGPRVQVDLDAMLKSFDALRQFAALKKRVNLDVDPEWDLARQELIRRFRLAPPGSPVHLRTATPFGLLHRYRQHFLYSKLRAGPLEQVRALAPWESLEVVMTESSQHTFEETVENLLEVTKSDSTEKKEEYELTDRIAASVAQSATMTISANGSSNAILWSASGSTTSNISSSTTQATEQVVRRLQETTRKQSEQIRKQTKITTRVVESRSESTTTRHVIRNRKQEPANYGLRRLGYDVDCKIQDLGPLLVWQSFIKRPGELLARSVLLDKQWNAAESKVETITVDFELISGSNHPGSQKISIPAGPKLKEIFQGNYKEQTPEDRKFFDAIVVEKYAAYITEDAGSEGHPDLQDTTGSYGGMKVDYDSANKIFIVDLGSTPKRWYNFKILARATSERRVQLSTDDSKKPESEKSEIQMARARLQAIMNFDKHRTRGSLEFEERKVLLAKTLGQLVDPASAGDLLDDRLASFYLEINDIFDLPRMFYDVDVAEWREAKMVAAGITRTSKSYPLHSEQNQPAPMGSSLEWDHQIDGDTRRDMFLNADFAFVGIPVKPGKEGEAEAFLRRCGFLMVDDRGITDLLKRLDRLRSAEKDVASQGFDADEVAVDPCDKPNRTPREFLEKDDPLTNLTWKDVYPIVSQHHTVTTVDGFLFDVLEVGGDRTDGDSNKPEEDPCEPEPIPPPPPPPLAA
jgi:hypothetical protein